MVKPGGYEMAELRNDEIQPKVMVSGFYTTPLVESPNSARRPRIFVTLKKEDKMAEKEIDKITELLHTTKVEEELSFKGRGFKLNKAEDGKRRKWFPKAKNKFYLLYSKLHVIATFPSALVSLSIENLKLKCSRC